MGLSGSVFKVSYEHAPPSASVSFRGLEIFQIGRRLTLPHRHQQAVGAEHIGIGADLDVLVSLDAAVLGPDRTRLLPAPVVLDRRPRPRQGMVEDGDLVV